MQAKSLIDEAISLNRPLNKKRESLRKSWPLLLLIKLYHRPQTNGKIERFRRTVEEDLLAGTYFESYQHLQQELTEYVYYYNHHRPHQGIGGTTPATFNQNCHRIT